jgi:hypothetical protein
VQDYLASKALNLGVDPYQRLDFLHSQYTPNDLTPMFTHATPHTPYSIYLFSLFGFENLNSAILIWYLFQMIVYVCFFLFLSSKVSFIRVNLLSRIAFVLVMLGSDPVRMELILGQWNFILLLFILAHVYANEKSLMLKGFSVISPVLIKSTGFAHMIYNLIFFNARQILIYFSIFLFSSLSIIYFNFKVEWVVNYFLNVAPKLSSIYLYEPANGSLLSSIAGLISVFANRQIAFESMIPFVILAFIAIILTLKSKAIVDSDLRVFYLWATSLLLLPVSWIHCLVLLLPCVCKILPRMCFDKLSQIDKVAGILLVFCWYFVRQPGLALMEYLSMNEHLIGSALNITGVWLSIYLLLLMIFITRIDKLSILKQE